MRVIGKVDSLWRYPVKSMRGEELPEAFVGFAGVYGDRVFAIGNSAAPKGFPWFTARKSHEMLLYAPRFRRPDAAAAPPNLDEAENIAPGATPVYAAIDDLAVDVTAPTGETYAIGDPALLERLGRGVGQKGDLSVLRSERALTDCRPVSLFSLQTVRQLAAEVEAPIDKRAFRANIYADLDGAAGFAENGFIGRTLRIGDKAAVAVIDTDPRCQMITLDPDTAEANPDILRAVVKNHGQMAGLYCAVLVEGRVRPGDAIALADG
jgi:uncharacterized protein YcbX